MELHEFTSQEPIDLNSIIDFYGKTRPDDQPFLTRHYLDAFSKGITITEITNAGATMPTPIDQFIDQAVTWYATEASTHDYPHILNHIATEQMELKKQ